MWMVGRTVRLATALTVGCLLGWVRDLPRYVDPDPAAERIYERWSQNASAIFWPVVAVWLAVTAPVWAVVVTVHAVLVVARRVAAAAGYGWTLRGMRWTASRWLTRRRVTVALATAAAAQLLRVVPTDGWHVTVVGRDPIAADVAFAALASAAPVAVAITLAVAFGRHEVARRRFAAAELPVVAEVLGVRGLTVDDVHIVRETDGLSVLSFPAAVVSKIDGLEERCALHMPARTVEMNRNDDGTVIGFRFRGATWGEREERALLDETGGLICRVTPIPDGSPEASTARPGAALVELGAGVTDAKAQEVAQHLRRLGHGDLVAFDATARRAVVARLPQHTFELRDALAKISKEYPHEIEVECLTGEEGDLDSVRVIRAGKAPIEDPTKRREVWLSRITQLLPPPPTDRRSWTYRPVPGTTMFALDLRRDPLDVVVPFDVDVTDTIDPSTPWRLGVDEEGRDIEINLAESAHMLIAGATRSGKSVATYGLLTHVLRMGPKAKLLVADPNDTTIAPFTDHVAWSTTATHPDDVTAMLEWVRRETDRRKPILRAMKTDKVSVFTEDLPMVVVVIDEAANYLRHGDKPAAAALAGELLAVVSQAGKYGVRLVLVTQRPDSTILPTSTRAQLSARISFRVEDLETAKMVFPDLPDPAALLECAPGVGFMREVGGKARRFRAVYLADHWEVAERLPHRQARIDVHAPVNAPVRPLAPPPGLPFAPPAGTTAVQIVDTGVAEFTLDDLEAELSAGACVDEDPFA